ncbi:hypothetical protein SERLA73DRAFT_142428 [Serpula lacrymans var. lacrymans S7.3]|uniref:Uncharacterized protein n=2 Tax=Serpula lacrymans var. lacrymans TaxID=341189 RepID=F8Q7T0_SERL3|nr:uncharacterized protein SERLADRAFT_398510 [Serpula lacrymans var. lacrymans S7.9]EGN95618.1 hypothetical protein SERLA73DRAFT_142428 [Serpula lacrymans var. lacrymans S7.3]EGO21145.1 hypothetical protein SERLADRAFT_398510 [Serpula lacrymans var. lacrymans S7.9]
MRRANTDSDSIICDPSKDCCSLQPFKDCIQLNGEICIWIRKEMQWKAQQQVDVDESTARRVAENGFADSIRYG